MTDLELKYKDLRKRYDRLRLDLDATVKTSHVIAEENAALKDHADVINRRNAVIKLLEEENERLIAECGKLEHLAQTLFTALETTAKGLEDTENLPQCAYEAIKQGREFGLKEAEND